MTYIPDEKRYEGASFKRCGRSGIVFFAIEMEAKPSQSIKT
jgi:hypothetical protein